MICYQQNRVLSSEFFLALKTKNKNLQVSGVHRNVKPVFLKYSWEIDMQVLNKPPSLMAGNLWILVFMIFINKTEVN